VKEYKFSGHILRPNGGKIICENCGKETRMMKAYVNVNDKSDRIVRCGNCDEFDDNENNNEQTNYN